MTTRRKWWVIGLFPVPLSTSKSELWTEATNENFNFKVVTSLKNHKIFQQFLPANILSLLTDKVHTCLTNFSCTFAGAGSRASHRYNVRSGHGLGRRWYDGSQQPCWSCKTPGPSRLPGCPSSSLQWSELQENPATVPDRDHHGESANNRKHWKQYFRGESQSASV